ncbi:SdrD B-like domain-containing protein [Spirosoma litoris]
MKQIYVSTADPYRKWLVALWVLVACITTANAQVKGIVFRDFDLNGIRSDTLPIEVGVAGVTVLAFVDLSKTPISTTTAADGSYSFNSTDVPAGKIVRVEFAGLPTGDYNGPFGTGSGTSVQFITAPSTTANLGINYPADYCQRTGVGIITPCYVNGNTQITTDKDGNTVPEDKQSAKADALVSFPYNASGVAGPTNFPPNHLATAGEVGAVWALAYQRRTKKVFSASVVKRHVSFGPGGPGGIYITDIASGTTTTFMSVSSVGIDVGDDPHADPLANLFGDKTQASTDPGSMSAAGRMSFGGMDISEDDKTLYFINLKDRKLYSLFIDSPAVVPTSATAVKSWSVPNPGCSNGDFRPWALKVYHGKIYVGVVCSAETSGLQSDLKATIYQFDPSTSVFTEVLAFPLDFRRGPTDVTTDPLHPENSCAKYDHWLPWTDAWPTPCGLGDNPTFVMHPQPIVADLEFDDDGSMLIGFLDRFGHMAGVKNHDPNGNGLYDGFTGGDLLRAAYTNGAFALESNGKSGNLTGSGVGNNEGPGGGEFFGKDYWYFIDHIGHSEVTNGALSFIPGYSEVITTAFDPIENVYQSGGLKVFNTKNGALNRNYVLYTLSPGSFGKASGLGANKSLCDPATVEIGNRVWFDDNRDGIQDAYEPGIDGIVLTLHDMENGGALVGTQTTHDGGQFYFNNTTVPGGLLYNHKYEIRMDTLQLPKLDITLNGTKPLAGAGGRVAARGARQGAAVPQRYYSLSPLNRSNYTDPDLRDSDAQLVGGSAVIAVTSKDAGQNDFTNDLSIYSCPELIAEKDPIEVCAGLAVDSIAALGSHLSRVDSVRFVLFTTPQSGTAMYGSGGVVLGTVMPDANSRAVLYHPAINTVNNTAAPSQQYVYAIIYPTPENPSCRQSSPVVIKVSPSLSASATGGEITCTVKQVTLKGHALYGDGSVASVATYAWTGPGSFTSAEQNPVVSVAGTYTLTISSLDCPGTLTTVTTNVTSDTTAPTNLTAAGAGLACVNCTATLYAEAPGATLLWSGPNGFTSTESEPVVSVPGDYTVTATGVNGCKVSASVELLPSNNDDPCINHVPVCVPITVRRIR